MKPFEQLFAEHTQALIKPGEEIVAEITPAKAHLLHMAAGVAGEAGELLDAIKKHTMYNKPLDIENVEEELGDIEFYMQGLRDALDLNRDDCLAHNMKKLGKRYPKGKFTNEDAQARADKNHLSVVLPVPKPDGGNDHG